MKKPTNQHGGVFVLVAMISVIAAIVIAVTFGGLKHSTKKADVRKAGVSLLNICEAGKEDALMKLRSGDVSFSPGQKVQLIASTPFGGGAYVVTCETNADSQETR